jgi:hypothetical protein
MGLTDDGSTSRWTRLFSSASLVTSSTSIGLLGAFLDAKLLNPPPAPHSAFNPFLTRPFPRALPFVDSASLSVWCILPRGLERGGSVVRSHSQAGVSRAVRTGLAERGWRRGVAVVLGESGVSGMRRAAYGDWTGFGEEGNAGEEEEMATVGGGDPKLIVAGPGRVSMAGGESREARRRS